MSFCWYLYFSLIIMCSTIQDVTCSEAVFYVKQGCVNFIFFPNTHKNVTNEQETIILRDKEKLDWSSFKKIHSPQFKHTLRLEYIGRWLVYLYVYACECLWIGGIKRSNFTYWVIPWKSKGQVGASRIIGGSPKE